ncbi:MAG: hypothetical protein ACPLXC_01665 [Candidatus Pacearchaeota archaeon]
MKTMSVEDLVDDLLPNKIVLVGEEDHQNRNVFEKEKTIISKLAEKSNKSLVIAMEYPPDTEEGSFKNYVDTVVDFFKNRKCEVVSIDVGRGGMRGLNMAKKIIELFNKYPNSIIVSIVGAEHLKASGSEIPANIRQEFHKNYDAYLPNVSRIILKDNFSRKEVSIEKDILGFYYTL